MVTIIIIISANAEWRAVGNYFVNNCTHTSPYGEWFTQKYDGVCDINDVIIFMHGGWGKVAAAASTQYAIDKWTPQIIINIGTCGGFDGEISRGDVILADRTLIYDIYEQMGDPIEHIQHYSTEIDVSWVAQPYPMEVRRSLLISADRDLIVDEIPILKAKFGAIAGDWESGAIAWVAKKNHTRCLILRGVTDIVGPGGGEAYNDPDFYNQQTTLVMKTLLDSLPFWFLKFKEVTQY
jgi:adenosylhomocysteine nucleosidase